ncbi:hypothetical protein RUM43_002440 [Polyplax serrata]|uniref:Uncharacterized protein n=1 Tax=Polyplax serrata TaxID=468196 RepID=A0AAN8S2M8_POLSC
MKGQRVDWCLKDLSEGSDQPKPPEEEEKEASWVSVNPPVELSDRCRHRVTMTSPPMIFLPVRFLCTRSDLETTRDNDQNEPTR